MQGGEEEMNERASEEVGWAGLWTRLLFNALGTGENRDGIGIAIAIGILNGRLLRWEAVGLMIMMKLYDYDMT